MSNYQRKKCLIIYVNQDEKNKFKEDRSRSTCRTLSEYGRKLLLGEPITVCYRDQSLDDITENFIQFHGEVEKLQNNGALTDPDKIRLFQQVENIRDMLTKYYQHASQDHTR